MDKSFTQKLHKDRNRILEFCNKFNHIFLYGTGITADQFLVYLEEEDIDIEGFVVSPGHKKETTHKGYPVFELRDVDLSESGIIISVSEKWHDEIKAILIKNGIELDSVLFQNIYYQENNTAVTSSDAYAGVRENGHFFNTYCQLDQLGKENGTDKSSLWHNYLNKYEFFLSHDKDKQLVLLELGVFNGESLKMWEEYFLQARIIGVDIDARCKKFETDRTDIEIVDLSSVKNLLELGEKYHPDIIVEDASHMWSHQIKSFVSLFPYLNNGGIFILEDIGTSFGKFRLSDYADSRYSCYEFLSGLTEMIAGGEIHINNRISQDFETELKSLSETIDMISFIYGSAIIIKK